MKEKAEEKLTFSNIEILFMIVMVALVIVSGITVFTITTKRQNVANFKESSSYIISAAKNAYAAIERRNSSAIVTSDDGEGKGMCITLEGLVANEFMKDDFLDLTKWDGYVVIEESSNGTFNYSLWVTNQEYVIDGYDSTKLEDLTTDDGITSYNDDNFSSKVRTSFTGTTSDKGGTGTGNNTKRYEAVCINESVN